MAPIPPNRENVSVIEVFNLDVPHFLYEAEVIGLSVFFDKRGEAVPRA